MRVLLISMLVVANLEPAAGGWTPWVLERASALRPPPPPSRSATEGELAELRRLSGTRDVTIDEVIAYWDTGPPSYRWHQLGMAALLEDSAYTHAGARALALLHVALHDAMVAAWDARYAYRRPRPHDVDRRVKTAVGVPRTPSYPAEHAVAAGAASEVLASLYPDRAAFYRERAAAAARSRLLAGANYPSDIAAGLTLGREVARQVIERGRTDGSQAAWTGRVPVAAGRWTGDHPVLPQAGRWRPWLLSRPDELRPPPPPAPGSERMTRELDEVLTIERTPQRIAAALFWEHAAGGTRSYQFWNDQLSRTLLEQRLGDNAPWAAGAYALLNVALYDAAIACWDAKYAYWAIRPVQLDPRVRSLFTTPHHPSYPSGHSCFGAAAATVLAHLFPRAAAVFEALAAEASESRLWAGIHFRSDLDAGRALGRAVGHRAMERAPFYSEASVRRRSR
jgi:membrane-associated phospholipid phosphatase